MSERGKTEVVWLDQEESYPVYSIVSENRFDLKAEISVETAARWRRVFADFQEVQGEMASAFAAARERRDHEDKVAKAAQVLADAQKNMDELTAARKAD